VSGHHRVVFFLLVAPFLFDHGEFVFDLAEFPLDVGEFLGVGVFVERRVMDYRGLYRSIAACARSFVVFILIVQLHPIHRAVFVAAKGREIKKGMRPDQRIAPTAVG